MRILNYKKFWQLASGITLIFIGLLGIILPILPGWPLIFIGVTIIGGIETLHALLTKHLPKKASNYIEKKLSRFDRTK